MNSTDPRVVIVDNRFFGEGVTVSGLLSGADLIAALHALPADLEDIVLPRGPFGFDGRATLDDVSAEEVGAAHPGRVHLAATPRELLWILRRASSGGHLAAANGLRRASSENHWQAQDEVAKRC